MKKLEYSIHYILIRGIEPYFKGSRQTIRNIIQHIHDEAMYGPNVVVQGYLDIN